MDFGELFKKAQELKETVSKQQEELAKKFFEGEAGGGMVKATVNGKQEVVSLTIDPELVTIKDIPMLQDLVVGAINEAFAKARKEVQGLLSQMMLGKNPPSL